MNNVSSRFIHSKTATMRPLPIERALKTDILTVLAVYDANSNLYGRFAYSIISLVFVSSKIKKE